MVEFNPEKHYHGKPCVKCGSDVRYILDDRCVGCARKRGEIRKQRERKKPKNMGIYQIINIVNNKRYIGSSVDIDKRTKVHLQSLKNNRHFNEHLQNSYNIYEKNNFVVETIEIVKDKTKLFEREQYWIDFYNWKELYNIAPKAGSCLDRKHTYKTKKQMSKKAKGRIITKEQRRKISNSLKNSESAKRAAKLNSINSPNKKSVAQIDIETGKIIRLFISVHQASRETGIDRSNIASVCNKKIKNKGGGRLSECKTAGGYKWRFVEDTE